MYDNLQNSSLDFDGKKQFGNSTKYEICVSF